MNGLVDSCLSADWPAPANILAFTTTRKGGFSQPPFDGWNLASHVGDQPDAVAQNRRQLCEALPDGARVNWLNQVHGCDISEPSEDLEPPAADAWFTQQTMQACGILTADCLPLLLCDIEGSEIAALHAGWRGVANGILQSAVQRFSGPANNILLWIGPGISRQHFQIGLDVREQLLASVRSQEALGCFIDSGHGDGKCFADLAQLIVLQGQQLGLGGVYGGQYCSYSDPQRFYSYRREPHTGRNASFIMRLS